MNTNNNILNTVTVPTNTKTEILRNTYRFNESHGNPFVTDEYEELSEFPINSLEERGYRFEHIYLTSNESPDVDGYYYTKRFSDGNGAIRKNSGDTAIEYKGEIDNHYNKVVASSDPSLNLPLIPKTFTKAFIKAHGKINKVRVELISNGNWKFERSSGYAGYRCTTCSLWIYEDNKTTSLNCKCGNSPKTREDGTIIILPTKTFTYEEVLRIAENARDQGARHKDILWDEWVNENIV